MSDYILLDGDKANFNPAFAIASVVVKPGTLEGSGKGTVGGKPVCVDGDEKKVEVANCSYVTATHSIPGSGTIKIDSLSGNQKAVKTKDEGKPVLLKGGLFVAKFEVKSPAKQPQPAPASPVPDPATSYPGNGTFQTTNQKFKGV